MKHDSPSAILHDLESFRQLGSVLYIAAHPDDENTELLAYLARGRKYRTAYLSLTRGDGGQNVLGSDLGEKLGVARTQELLAARKLDGAQQFFSRAVDFGFSKNHTETLNVWNKDAILSDVVRVIRVFRPDVLITRFSPNPGGTHGHHTASSVLALEAFKLAGDPKSFPEQGLPPWQPKRIMWNISTFQRDKAVGINAFKIDAAGKDSVTGETFMDLAGKSRAMHKTQGFDTFKIAGANGEPRFESFHNLDGDAATKDIFDGVDTSWNRVPGGAAIGKASDEVLAQFKAVDPSASVPALLKLRSQLDALKSNDSIVKEKRLQLDRILQECLGLTVETTVPHFEVVPGEALKLQHSATVHSKIPVRWIAVRYPELKKEVSKGIDLRTGETSSWDSVETVPAGTPLTQPWWLRKEGTAGLFGFEDAQLIGTAENLPPLLVENVFEVDGQELVVRDEPVLLIDEAGGTPALPGGTRPAPHEKIRRRLDVIPPVSLRFVSDVVLLAPGKSRTVDVEITSSRADSSGELRLEAPSGWTITPPKQPFHLNKIGEHVQLKFTITSPKQNTASAPKNGTVSTAKEIATITSGIVPPGSASEYPTGPMVSAANHGVGAERVPPAHTPTLAVKIIASAEMNGVHYRNQRTPVNYGHIPPQLLQPLAVLKVVNLTLLTRGHTVGYLPGAGDSLPENIREMGYTVKILDDATLTAEQLSGLDAVVIGVRAFNVREKIGAAMPLLFDYVKNGGTVISQYNRPDKLKSDKIAPYDLHISADRVTDENAAITFLAPEHPVLNKPNKITSADFDGWVQERGIYFPNQWDEHFTPILSCHDSGEEPTKGALLVAQYGKGYYIYTGLVFFRELPAGVPGAYRLFANLLSINK